MKFFELKVYVGPGRAAFYAQKASEAGWVVSGEGTEHLYVMGSPVDSCETYALFMDALKAKFGTTYGLTFRDLKGVAAKEL